MVWDQDVAGSNPAIPTFLVWVDMKRWKLKRALKKYRKLIFPLDLLLQTFEINNYEYAIIGGFVRRVLTDNWKGFVDIDVVVDLPKNEIEHILRSYRLSTRENSNGGFSIYDRYSKMKVDLWSLQDHKPFTVNFPWAKRTFKNIQEVSIISTDGGTYLPQKNKLYCKYLNQSIKENKVFLLCCPYNFLGKSVIGARLKFLEDTTSFSLNCAAKEFVNYCFQSEKTKTLAESYYKHLVGVHSKK